MSGGWTDVTDTAGVRSGGVTGVNVDGHELVVWRDAGGAPCVMDARCPHQWSHLPAEAVVDGSELVCTTHFWRYDRSGAGWKQAFSGRRDRKGDIVVYPCREEGPDPGPASSGLSQSEDRRRPTSARRSPARASTPCPIWWHSSWELGLTESLAVGYRLSRAARRCCGSCEQRSR